MASAEAYSTSEELHAGSTKGNSADKLRMPRICCLFSCWISSRSRHAELVCTITRPSIRPFLVKPNRFYSVDHSDYLESGYRIIYTHVENQRRRSIGRDDLLETLFRDSDCCCCCWEGDDDVSEVREDDWVWCTCALVTTGEWSATAATGNPNPDPKKGSLGSIPTWRYVPATAIVNTDDHSPLSDSAHCLSVH